MRCGIKPLNNGRCTKTAKFIHLEDGPFCPEHYYDAVIKQPNDLSDEQKQRNRLREKRMTIIVAGYVPNWTVIPRNIRDPRKGFKEFGLKTWNKLKRGKFDEV